MFVELKPLLKERTPVITVAKVDVKTEGKRDSDKIEGERRASFDYSP